ncbi:hypothetical protein EIP86_011604 [Pleurotus ostreatoroseus]|nr:hypothetical protein EIP86_011604 [Pleurotus ostreatoroseus]
MVDTAKALLVPVPTPGDAMDIEKAIVNHENLVHEALPLLKRNADRGHMPFQYSFADCYDNGSGIHKNKQDFDDINPLFVLAAKHGHPDAAYRTKTCCENVRRERLSDLGLQRRAESTFPANAEHMQDDEQAEEQDEFVEIAADREFESRTANTHYSPIVFFLIKTQCTDLPSTAPCTQPPRLGGNKGSQSDGTNNDLYTDDLPDGYLRPPVLHTRARRNTVSAGMPFPSQARPPQPRAMTVQSLHVNDDRDIDELATDIQQQVEQIRRERISKRAKAAQEAEHAKARQETEHVLTRTASLVPAFSRREEGPLVGNLIGEGHVNYVLMYNMLTGIRTAVSRCQAKVRRPLAPEDFKAAHKYSFDFVGNELTPSAKYDFKFKDYAPWVFRELREDHFCLGPADYLLSLTAKYILSELGSPGKSGSFFYFSRDYRFIIKTIHRTEHKFLRRILPQYHAHIKNNPHTLLSRFYGLHRVKLPHGRKIHFVIMNNLFPPHKDVHETYDLKGSTVGREYPEPKMRENPRAVLKDLNWINRSKTLELGPEKRALLTEQLKRDFDLLRRLHVMDYSLLVGVHNMVRGNRDNVRRNTLKVFSPNVPVVKRKAASPKGTPSPEAAAMRRVVRGSDPQSLGVGNVALPDEDLGERQHLIFYQDEGGLRATDEANEDPDTIYYLGVIDILTPYTPLKKLENVWKARLALPPPEPRHVASTWLPHGRPQGYQSRAPRIPSRRP